MEGIKIENSNDLSVPVSFLVEKLDKWINECQLEADSFLKDCIFA